MQRAHRRTEKPGARRKRSKNAIPDPVKQKAQRAAAGAARAGLIFKSDICECCKRGERRLEGHHHLGYDQPLEVVWLCRECHGFVHSKIFLGTRDASQGIFLSGGNRAKFCSKCEKTKLAAEFYERVPGILRNWCKPCASKNAYEGTKRRREKSRSNSV